ncbi:uncharacterized protein BDZ99DRAFT_573271 [Mytilinidion resinicola]|uniref:G-protein coupled receptors family 1 profile domain-containing protein n=1 Tax=Mytilinidion resinicola TaxID=574789 RepID=A0A6A6YHG5_9PEZI|nr:uncharacterized protein BDZ99DRAFT_573271 [Mytilinidion resinicola]KAF2807444.1 hypothetical protein BDZ99DRAFT_573271 [Mytilinidion resinicola]
MAFNSRAEMFPFPYSIDPMPRGMREGLIGVAIFATFSVLSTSVLIALIAHCLYTWRYCYRQYIQANQYVLFILNLLIADFQPALALMISWHWVGLGKIIAPTTACFTQAWFLHIGDVASGAFVLAVAVHTNIVAIWIFAIVMTNIGPILHKNSFFTRAGAWCWVSPKYESERLFFHYLWIFIDQASTLRIYLYLFHRMRNQLQDPKSGLSYESATTKSLWRATWYMFLYAGAYLVLISPLAIGSMIAMSGYTLPDAYLLVAGCVMTSCGCVDVLTYTYTHRTLVSSAPEVSEQQRRSASPPRHIIKDSIELHGLGLETEITGPVRAVPAKYQKGVRSHEDLTFPPTVARHALSAEPAVDTRHDTGGFNFELR